MVNKYLADKYVVCPAEQPPFVQCFFGDYGCLTSGFTGFLRDGIPSPRGGQAEENNQDIYNVCNSLGLAHLTSKITCSRLNVNGF
jgi:hypothetical protein